MAIINFTNFIDGIDGLLASNISVTFFCMSILLDMHYLIICGSLIGFLIWNWSPAKIFMGDSGSTFLGGMLFFGILSCRELDQAIGILLTSSPILIDPFICVIRRFMNKQEIFLPHKQHFYQRLNQAGWTHNKVSILYFSCSLLISLCYLLYGLKISIFSFMVCFSYCFWLNYKIAVPFKK